MKEIAEVSNANSSNDDLDDVSKNDDTARESIRIERFWGRNRAIMPWMDQLLPVNAILKDAVATIIGIIFSYVIFFIISHLFIKSEKIAGILCILSGAYFLSSFNIRMFSAQRRFFAAKRDGGKK